MGLLYLLLAASGIGSFPLWKGDMAFDFFELLHSECRLDFGNKGTERRETQLRALCLFVCLFVQQAATTKGHHHQAKIFSKTKKGYIQLQYSCQLMSELLRFLEYFTVSGLLQLRLQDVCRKLD